MKQIHKHIIAAAAILASALAAYAQTVPVGETDAIATTKKVSDADENGYYTITLETWAKGTSTFVSSSVPSDVILLLDVSSSMDGNYTTNYTYTGTTQEWSYNGVENTNRYYKDGDEYYKVTRNSTTSRPTYYRLSYQKNGTTYYLSGDGTTTTAPTNVTNNTSTIFTGTLYTRSSPVSKSRLEALKDAVSGFLSEIKTNAEESRETDPDYAGNKVAIIAYSGSAVNTTAGWVDVENGYTSLTTAVEGLSTSTGTRPDLSLQRAIDNLLDGTPNKSREDANLTVLLFTDGYPSTSGSTNFTVQYANNSLYYAQKIKKDYGAKLFTVGLITEASTDNYYRVLKLMDWLSSNYPDATIDPGNITPNSEDETYITTEWKVTGSGTNRVVTNASVTPGTEDTENEYFFLVNADMDLSTIFEAISKQSGGSAQSIGSQTQVRDAVSSSFVIPDDTEEADIKVYTCDINEDGTWPTADADGDGLVDAWKEFTTDDGLSVEFKWLDDNGEFVDEDTDGAHKTVVVEGFDFSLDDTEDDDGNITDYGNWVGERYIAKPPSFGRARNS